MKLKEYLPTMADAVEAMCDGLVAQSKRRNFKIVMNTFGDFYRNNKAICFGCAATCTIQQAVGINYTSKTILERHSIDALEADDVDEFEVAMDRVRKGSFGTLRYLWAYYYGSADNYLYWPVDFDEICDMDHMPYLATDNWEHHLPIYRRLAENLRGLGL